MVQLTEIEDDDTDNLLVMQNGATHDVTLLKYPEYEPEEGISTYDFAQTQIEASSLTVDGVTMELENADQLAHYMCNVATYQQLTEWFNYLKVNDCWDNTRIIIVADHGRDLGQFDYMELSNGLDVEFYNPLLLVKDFGATEYTVSDEFMTNADVPTMALSGIIENPVNPFTGNLISSNAKNSALYVTTSDNYDINRNDGYVLETSDGEWYTVKDNIFDVNNWTKVEETK
jgi:membrane-anchored protein YejM (alkaline phosphatase superfamily)